MVSKILTSQDIITQVWSIKANTITRQETEKWQIMSMGQWLSGGWPNPWQKGHRVSNFEFWSTSSGFLCLNLRRWSVGPNYPCVLRSSDDTFCLWENKETSKAHGRINAQWQKTTTAHHRVDFCMVWKGTSKHYHWPSSTKAVAKTEPSSSTTEESQ